MSDASYHDSVTVETEIKQNDDVYYFDISNFKYFGISEKATQTILTLNKVKEIVNNNKQLKENNKTKQESLMAPLNSSNKKEITNILIEPIKIFDAKNQIIDGKNSSKDNNNDNMQIITKSSKKSKREEKKEGKKDKDNLLDKKRKRPDEEIQSPTKNKTKFQEINKSKEKKDFR